MDLVSVGDRELWVLDGDDHSWSLPICLDWKVDKTTNEEYAFLYCALSPYPNQSLALRARLNPFSMLDATDRWLMPKSSVIRLLRKAPGITPRYYYKWPDPHYQPIPVAAPMRIDRDLGAQAGSWDFEQFLKYVSQRWSIPLSMLRAVWKAVCQEAPVWMMESRRPLDLGFCKVVALPFRANWKEIVRAKFSTYKLAGLFRLPNYQQRQAMEDAQLPQALCSPHNIGMYRAGGNSATTRRLHYTLEAIPTGRWENAVNIVEGKRVSCGGTSYVANFEQTVERQYDLILASLSNYVRKISAPFARVFESRQTGNLKFVPTKRPEELRGVDPRHIPVDIVAPDSPFSVLGEQKRPTRVRRKDEDLHGVRPLPQADQDVRQPDGGEPGGLSLLHADQGSAEREPVLSSPEAGPRGSSGVGSGTEREMNHERRDANTTTTDTSDTGTGSGCSSDDPQGAA